MAVAVDSEIARSIVALIEAAKPIPRPEIDRVENRTSGGKSSKKREGSGGSDETEPPKPRALGFDIDKMNKEWALILLGSKAVVFLEHPEAVFEDSKRFLTVGAFSTWHANRFTEIVVDGKIKRTTWDQAWLRSPQRRSYRGIEFFPDPNNAPGTEGYLNLWSGFSVTPCNGGWQRYKTFHDHLLNNVCDGNDHHFRWVFGFFAQMLQRPRERIGVALVLRGDEGCGKTKVGEVIGSLIRDHYFLVDDPRYVTGNFNAHMASCLLLQADEAVWAGDKKAEGRLKGLITSPFQQIEPKGTDPIRLKNYVRLLFTGNEDWVVPAGKTARRPCVLDVNPRCIGNFEYFSEMDEELDNGGREALLADLLSFDLDSVDLRTIPKTEALLEQKIASFGSIDAWWFQRLQSGSITRGRCDWPTEIKTEELWDDYIIGADKVGIKRKADETVFGIALRKLMPGGADEGGLVKKRREEGRTDGKRDRKYVYKLPTLEKARELFEAAVGQPITWDE